MSILTQITEEQMLSRLQVGEVGLEPLRVKSFTRLGGASNQADARVELALPDEREVFRFVVENKTRGTPQAIQLAVAQVKSSVGEGEWPMIQVPYLSEESIRQLETQGVSGVDLCGNGLVIVPGRIFVVRVGKPNQYPDSRPLNNPYRGRSAMVARMLLRRPRWQTLTELAGAISASGGELSLPQVSKAVQALKEDLIVSKKDGTLQLGDALRLLDRLGREWRGGLIKSRQFLRLPAGTGLPQALNSEATLRWAMTGETAVTRYTSFSQTGPRRIAVSHLSQAMKLLGGIPEPVPSFADIELLETDEVGYFFDLETDDQGLRWAGRLQTWLELQAGDARQQEAARDLRDQILKEVRS